MNKKLRNIIILGAVLAGGIIAAVVGYNTLNSKVSPESVVSQAGETVSVPGAEGETQEKKQTAADFTMLDSEGNEVRLADFYGKPTIINFWATWCPPCRSEMPTFNKIYKENGDVVNFMMVNLTDGVRDDVDSVKEFISQSGYDFPVYFDTNEQGASEYGVMYIPTTVVINKDGTVLETYSGAMNEDKLNSYIEELLYK